MELCSYQKIRQIRDWFLSLHSNSYQLSKIWSRFIITHQSFATFSSELIPSHSIDYDDQLTQELRQLFSKEVADQVFTDLINQCLNYKESIGDDNSGVHITRYEIGNQVYFWDNNKDFSQSIKSSKYQALKSRYSGDTSDQDIWRLLVQYSLLGDNGLQLTTRPEVLDFINRHMGCDTELFASPINAKLKNYYSLFSSDKAFGSNGNFFQIDRLAPGTYYANPPFIEKIFEMSYQKIKGWLDLSDIYTFIYVMPDWKDFDCFQNMMKSKYLIHHLELPDASYYCPVDESNVEIHTHVFILSNNKGLLDIDLDKFEKSWYVGGAPRAHPLRGIV